MKIVETKERIKWKCESKKKKYMEMWEKSKYKVEMWK